MPSGVAVGEDPVEARLLGEGADCGDIVVPPRRYQAVGAGRAAVELPLCNLESALGNPGFEEVAARVHKSRRFCDGSIYQPSRFACPSPVTGRHEKKTMLRIG